MFAGWIKGDLDLDAAGFLIDFGVNELEDRVIGRMSRAISRGEIDFNRGFYSNTQRLNTLRRTTIQGGY